MKFNRRDFLGFAAAAGAFGAAGCASSSATDDLPRGRMLFGICIGNNLKTVAEMKEIGYDFFEGSVGSTLIPTKDGDDWKRQRDAILAAELPIRSCNGFLPGTFRLTGPNASFDEPLAYAEKACKRADEVGLPFIVFGSGGARNVPGDICAQKREDKPNVERGAEQFAEFCGKLAKRIDGCKVTIVIEPLCPNESNIVNYVWQGLQIVEQVDSPRIQQLADLYHMAQGKEPATSIIIAGSRLKHCHIATPKTRQAPGLDEPGALIDYFKALRRIGYTGGVSCECGWGPKGTDRREARANALAQMRKWAGMA